MMEARIQEVLARKDEQRRAQGLNKIVDELRGGRGVADVISLLDAKDSEVIAIGAWILSELRVELYDFPEFVERLSRLLRHPSDSVRLHALGAVFPMLDAGEPSTRELLEDMCNDSNEGVRLTAKAAISSLDGK